MRIKRVFKKDIPMLMITIGIVISVIAAHANSETQRLNLRMVSIKQGNVDNLFEHDPERFKGTKVYKAAKKSGVDIQSPSHPLVVHSFKNGQLYYLFYNTVENAYGDHQYLIQRVKKTVKNYTDADDIEPDIKVTYLVEAFKTHLGSIKKSDSHYGRFALGRNYKREIIKELEIGFGTIPRVATMRRWPFKQKTLYKKLQDYGPDHTLYDDVRYKWSLVWTIKVSLDREGNYSVEVPELGINAPTRLPNLQSAKPRLDPNSLNLVLYEGRGVEQLVVGRSRARDIRRVLGTPLQVERTSGRATNYYYDRGLSFNVFNRGVLNKIITQPSFGGRTSKGIRHGDTRDHVFRVYGVPSRSTSSSYLIYPGVTYYFDAENRVNKIVITRLRT